jgi:hypothetical protein
MRALLLGFLLLAAEPVLAAEKYVGSNVDSRTILAFKVTDAAVQKFQASGLGAGRDHRWPGQGRQSQRHLHRSDREPGRGGQGARSGSDCYPDHPGENEGIGDARDVTPGPYGVSVHASANMERKVRIDPAGTATVEESWEFRSQDGDSIQLQMQYVRGPSTPGKAEAKLYSAVKPEFYRIYRSEQSTDVVRSATADRVQKVQFKASGPKLSPLFDGSEQLIGVTSNPWYTRQTFLPAS